MITERFSALRTLSDEEKLILVGELWEELAATPDGLPLREDHVGIIEERLEDFRKNPAGTVRWEDLKARLLVHS